MQNNINEESILNSIKACLNINDNDDGYNTELLLAINTTIAKLTQMGIGPSTGFFVSDATQRWFDFIGNSKEKMMVKTYMYIKVKMIFDPPTNSVITQSLEKEATELEIRMVNSIEGDDDNGI